MMNAVDRQSFVVGDSPVLGTFESDSFACYTEKNMEKGWGWCETIADHCLFCIGYFDCSSLPWEQYFSIAGDRPIYSHRA